MYWSMAASFTLFGPQDWAARLPLAIATLALFLVVYATGRRLFASDIAGFYAALILLTSFGIFIYTRIIIPDVIVCLWLSASPCCCSGSLLSNHSLRAATAWGFAAACALNVLTKGLIGIVFPLGIVFIFLLLNRNMGHLRRWHPFSSLLVFLVIALPWHIAAGIANPSQGNPNGTMPAPGNVHGFFWFYFVNEQVLRYLNRRVPRDYDTVPLLLFWGLLAVWLMPWIAFVFRRSCADRSRRCRDTIRPGNCLAYGPQFVMVFFSFSTRQEYYALPALPPLALMIGGWLGREEKCSARDPRRIAGRRIAIVLFLLGATGGLLAAYLAIRAPAPGPGRGYYPPCSRRTRRLCALAGSFSRSEHAGHERLPPAADSDRDCAGGGNAGQPDPALRQQDPDGKLRAFRHDGCLPDRRAHGVGHLLARAFLKGSGGCDSARGCRPATWWRSMANTKPVRPWGSICAARSAFSTAVLPISGMARSSAMRRRSSMTTHRFGGCGVGRNGSFCGPRLDQVPALPGPAYAIAQSGGKEILSNRP